MSDAQRDQNHVPSALGVSSVDGFTTIPFTIDPITGRLLVDASGGSGTVTTVSVVTNQGVSGSVANATTTPAITLSLGALTGVTSLNGLVVTANTGVVTTGTWNGTKIAVAYGGTNLTSISALSVLVANVANTFLEITPGAGQSIRVNAGATAWEVFTPSAAVPTTITVANEAADATCFPLFVTAATGDLGPKTNAALIFDSTTGAFGATSIKTTSATPFALTNAQIVSIALTAQTVGATTLTIPDFASVVDEFVFKTKAVTMSNKTFVAPVLGAATATSINGLIITTTTGTFTLTNAKTLSVSATLTLAGTDGKTLTVSNSGTLAGGDAFVLAIAAGKTLTVSNSLTLAGTDSTVMTFPTTSKTIAANDGSNWTFASQAIGDLVYASSTTAFTRLAAVAVGQVLVSAGTGTAPAYSANPQITTIELGNASDTTLARVSAGVMSVEGVTVPTISSTSTITNKRNQPRIVSAASYTTDTGTSLDVSTTDIFVITAQAGALLFNAPGGTPVQGEKLVIRIKDNGTARALTWNAVFRAMGTALPSTTVLSKTLYLGFFYNSTDTKWDLVASAQEA